MFKALRSPRQPTRGGIPPLLQASWRGYIATGGTPMGNTDFNRAALYVQAPVTFWLATPTRACTRSGTFEISVCDSRSIRFVEQSVLPQLAKHIASFGNPKVHYRVNKSRKLDLFLSQTNVVHTMTSYIRSNHFNIIIHIRMNKCATTRNWLDLPYMQAASRSMSLSSICSSLVTFVTAVTKPSIRR